MNTNKALIQEMATLLASKTPFERVTMKAMKGMKKRSSSLPSVNDFNKAIEKTYFKKGN